MGKRRYGSGAVKLRPDGRWEGQLRLADGRRRSVYAQSREQVIARLQEERWRLTWGIPRRAGGLLLGEYLPQWLAVARTRLRPRTVESYDLCSRRIDRELGQVPLGRLTPQMVQGAYARMLISGLSARTVFQTHAVLHRALRQAHRWGLMAADPTELVAAPRPRTREMTALPTRSWRSYWPAHAAAAGTRFGCCWARPGCASGRRWGCDGATSTSTRVACRSGARSSASAAAAWSSWSRRRRGVAASSTCPSWQSKRCGSSERDPTVVWYS
jgi:Phage integrase, N-terminal SAM-like domain